MALPDFLNERTRDQLFKLTGITDPQMRLDLLDVLYNMAASIAEDNLVDQIDNDYGSLSIKSMADVERTLSKAAEALAALHPAQIQELNALFEKTIQGRTRPGDLGDPRRQYLIDPSLITALDPAEDAEKPGNVWLLDLLLTARKWLKDNEGRSYHQGKKSDWFMGRLKEALFEVFLKWNLRRPGDDDIDAVEVEEIEWMATFAYLVLSDEVFRERFGFTSQVPSVGEPSRGHEGRMNRYAREFYKGPQGQKILMNRVRSGSDQVKVPAALTHQFSPSQPIRKAIAQSARTGDHT